MDDIAETPASESPTPPADPPPVALSEPDDVMPEPSVDPVTALTGRDHPFG
jgi:hypothetical protein